MPLLALVLCVSAHHATAQAPALPIPADPRAAAEQAEFLARNVPAAPLPAGSPGLDVMRARASGILEQHARYHEGVASGKIIPHAHLHEIRPQLERDLAALTQSLDQIQTEDDPAKKETLSKAFFAALQPIGGHLETADPGQGHINLLSAPQQSELAHLEQAWDAADKVYDATAEPLHFLGPGQLYTITRLSVPVMVQAPTSSKVIFQTFDGGFFTNQLALIEVKAGADGIARTEWITHGDAINDTVIGVRSAAAPPAANLTITTVRMELSPLPAPPASPVPPAILPGGE